MLLKQWLWVLLFLRAGYCFCKIWNQYKLRGAYIDLDGHFGNSIEDSKSFIKDLNTIIPYNINPTGSHDTYLENLALELNRLSNDLLAGKINYVVFCHGADSHEWDDLGFQCTTEEWLKSSELVYKMIYRVSRKLAKPIPLSLSLLEAIVMMTLILFSVFTLLIYVNVWIFLWTGYSLFASR